MTDLLAPWSPAAPYEQAIEHAEYRAFIYGHPNTQYVRWWRAIINPAISRLTGRGASPFSKWIWEEQDVSNYRAVISDVRQMKRYLPHGDFETGDMSMMSMSNEIPVGDHDWVVPMGIEPRDARTMQYKEPLPRGGFAESPDGTVVSSGTTVTGAGTTFTAFHAGDILDCAGSQVRIDHIVSDTSLVVDVAPSPSWNGNTFTRRREAVSHYPLKSVEEIRDAEHIYHSESDFTIASDRFIVWNTAAGSPPPGSGLSIVYQYFPRFMCIPDMHITSHPVQGVASPQVVTLRLVKPETLQE